MSRILIIDDEISLCELLVRYVSGMDMEAAKAHSVEEGLKQAGVSQPDVIFLDVMLPDGNGLELIPQLQRIAPEAEIVVMTGAGDEESAELAIRQGAWSYILKGGGLKPFADVITNILKFRQGTTAQLGQPLSGESVGIIGGSRQIQSCLDLASEASLTEANVLITGETGTGKELLARAIHGGSRRKRGNFIVVDCTALPETLVESVLFGHAKGSFTGADRTHEGLVGQANGGTLFIDEVGELPLRMQRSFLRVLQERRYRPVGGEHELHSDFRVIAATHRDLEAMVSQSHFRQDLLYRLRSFHINLPALRNRVIDISDIARHHVDAICRRYEIPMKETAEDFMECLCAYTWPGNVRELVQALERAVASALRREVLFAKHLPEYIQIAVVRQNTALQLRRHLPAESVQEEHVKGLAPFREHRDEGIDRVERAYLEKLIATAQGDPQAACDISELSKSRLYALLQKHGLSLRSS